MIAAALAAAAVAMTTASAPPGYAVVKRIDLSAALGLRGPWFATIQAPTGPDAQTGDAPVRVCIQGGGQDGPACDAIVSRGYGFQTFVDAKVETLSVTPRLRALVVRADYTAGGDGLRATAMFAYEGARVGFLKTFTTDVTDVGEGAVFASGPLAGDYVSADFVITRRDETRWGDPHRFSVSVYRVDPSDGGYLQVLQYVTKGRYPAERQAPHGVVDAETPTILRLLHEIYPDGPPR